MLNNPSAPATATTAENAPEEPPTKRPNGVHKEVAAAAALVMPAEEVLNGLSMHSPPKVMKTGGSADHNNDLISVKAAVGSEDEDKIQEYLKRSDTAVIYPEPVGNTGKFRCWITESYIVGTLAISRQL